MRCTPLRPRVLLGALLAAGTSLGLLPACESEPVRYPAVTTAVATPAITAAIPLPPPVVRARLLACLRATDSLALQLPAHPDYGPQFARYELLSNETRRLDEVFQRIDPYNSSAALPLTTAFHSPTAVTSRLLAYLALPAAARTQDVYVHPVQHWPTPDYRTTTGQSLPYSCAYLLHLTACPGDSTRVEIIALDSYVVDGTRWGWRTAPDGLGLPWPGRVPRYRDVVPARNDQRQVLTRLVELMQ